VSPSGIKTRRLDGLEAFTRAGAVAGMTVLDFWRWSSSELAGNTLRGVLAEFLVAHALGIDEGHRTEWAPADIETPEGVRIEVKSASYQQVWAQARPSPIRFRIAPARRWEAQVGTYEAAPRRQAHVYVFAILGRSEEHSAEPLHLDDWEFLVLPTWRLTKRVGDQKTIGLKSLLSLGPSRVGYAGLAECIRSVQAEAMDEPV
jgi:hypothetical protein